MKKILFILLAAAGMASCQDPVKVRIPEKGTYMIMLTGNAVAQAGDTIHVQFNMYTDCWQHEPSGRYGAIGIVE
ncbi:MAG: lipoprotein [Bacteroidota bacterium]